MVSSSSSAIETKLEIVYRGSPARNYLVRPAGIGVCILAITLSAAGTVLGADVLPDLDPIKLCRRQAESIGQGDWMVKACLDQEQEAYDVLNVRWSNIDSKTQALCTKQSQSIGQGYWMIQACVEQEMEAKQNLQNFKFKK